MYQIEFGDAIARKPVWRKSLTNTGQCKGEKRIASRANAFVLCVVMRERMKASYMHLSRRASVAKMLQRVDPDRQRREEATPSSNGYEILMTWSHNGINRRVRSFVWTQWRFFGAGIHPINMHRYDHIRGDNVPHACSIHSTTYARMRARDRISNFGEMFSATNGIKTRLIRSDFRSISRLS